jgi:hypothetical protein
MHPVAEAQQYWTMFAVFVAIMAACLTVVIAAVKAMTTRVARDCDRSIVALDKKVEDNQKLERQFLEMKADLPLNYVRKEDFIRHEVVINTKLDRIYEKLQGGVECN